MIELVEVSVKFVVICSSGHVGHSEASSTGGLGKSRCIGCGYAPGHWRHAALHYTTGNALDYTLVTIVVFQAGDVLFKRAGNFQSVH